MEIKRWLNQLSSKANNPDTERDFRANCLLCESQFPASTQSLKEDYQEYINLYHRITSLYAIKLDDDGAKLIIYDTENNREEEKTLEKLEKLKFCKSITQLPNGDVFCNCSLERSEIAIIIDRNYDVNILSAEAPCYILSCIYLNNSVYCFGERLWDKIWIRFDLNEHRWRNLTKMPLFDLSCHSVVFNGNILMATPFYRNLLLYSPDIDSFSTIPYDFTEKLKKILINADKLYLIECSRNGFIYESEDEYNWKPISKSTNNEVPTLVFDAYCVYNKGGIYILTNSKERYYKFDLNQKVITKF